MVGKYGGSKTVKELIEQKVNVILKQYDILMKKEIEKFKDLLKKDAEHKEEQLNLILNLIVSKLINSDIKDIDNIDNKEDEDDELLEAVAESKTESETEITGNNNNDFNDADF